MEPKTINSLVDGSLPTRVFAVDWSGDKRNGRRKIWIGEAVNGQLLRLENGRNVDQVAKFFMCEANRDKNFVVGFDFAFSFPMPYCDSLNIQTIHQLWKTVSIDGERWLAECKIPFWGKPGRTRQTAGEPFRRTELAVARKAANPKSIFQIGGAGAVGTGSIRGMPLLARLHDAGFSIWPFDMPAWPLVVEIYPRLLTGAVNKSSQSSRASYLAKLAALMSKEFFDAASRSEDAFDAAVSVLAMSRRTVEFGELRQSIETWELIEGKIWY